MADIQILLFLETKKASSL